MLNSLKDRLNSAVNAGIGPRLEDAKKRLSGEESEGAVKAGSSMQAPISTGSNLKPIRPEEEARATIANQGGPPLAAEAEVGANPRDSMDSSKEVVTEESCAPELPEEVKKKLEKLKRYEVKYPGKLA